MPLDSVAIEAGDARLRKHAVQQFFQLLRAGSEKIHIFTAAMDAGLGHRRSEATIVANHFMLTLVVSEGDGTILAFQSLAAGAAQHDRRISAAVKQDHYLLFAIEPLFDLCSQLAGDDLLMAGF